MRSAVRDRMAGAMKRGQAAFRRRVEEEERGPAMAEARGYRRNARQVAGGTRPNDVVDCVWYQMIPWEGPR